MSKTYYVRIRGRVQGPFDVNKLRTLVRRGQVSRTHEVSEDNVSWSPAIEYAELFEAPTQVVNRAFAETVTSGNTADDVSEEPNTTEKDPPAGSEAAWYYAIGSDQTGPVNYNTLQHLLRIGQLAPETEVWATGMDNWEPANTIQGLVPVLQRQPQQKSPTTTSVTKSEYDSKHLVPLFKSMRTWTMMISIVGLVLCLIQLIRGVILIAANNGIAGLMFVTGAMVQGAAYAMLLSFTLRIGGFLIDRTENRLLAALRAMRAFWMYVGVLLSILLALLLVLISLLMAGVDFASWK